MSFQEHIAHAPLWLQAWLTWLVVVNLAAVLFLIRWHDGKLRLGHIEAFAIAASMIAIAFLMPWLFHQVGYVRLLGLGHIPIWTPLAIYLWTRLSHHRANSLFGMYLRLLLVTILISLAFDYTDVARYFMGEQGTM